MANCLNRLHTALLATMLILLVVPVLASTPKIVKRASVDLNGDSKTDTVSIIISDTHFGPDYVLYANKAEARGYFEGVAGFAVVDLDTTDKRKEIAVFTPGPSEDPAYRIYSYDGKRLLQIGEVFGRAEFPGNGTVLVDSWQGSWTQRDKYAIDKASGKLVLVPQELHWVNQTVTVSKSFPLYRSHSSKEVVANLRPKSKILLVAAASLNYMDPNSLPAYMDSPDPDKRRAEDYMNTWLLIKSESGLLGWAQLKTLHSCTSDLPMAG